MSFAPPVSKDGFHYNGDLYVEVGNLNRHKRASIAEIMSLLRPDLKKTTIAQNPQDQVGHWYEAQLIHYGLPPSKDKARAKMRLLEALNGSKLAVPKNISKLEADLKKEYAAADKKAKAAYKAQVEASTPRAAPASKKRKQSEVVNNVNVNISFGSQGEVVINRGATEKSPPAKKVKTAASKPTAKASPVKKAGVSAAKTPKEKIQSAQQEETKSRPKQTARRSTGSFSIGRRPSNVATTAPEDEKPRKKQTARRSTGSFPIGQRLSSIPAVKRENIKKEAKVKPEPSSQDLPKLGLLNGNYDISCPTVESEWPNWARNMSLSLTLDSPHLWGAYDLGIFSGILRLEERPYTSSLEPLPCKWRGRENSEGEMSYGNHCTGAITFLGDGRIEGWLGVYGRLEFYASRIPGPGTAPRTAASMKQEGDGYNETQAAAAARGRWGNGKWEGW